MTPPTAPHPYSEETPKMTETGPRPVAFTTADDGTPGVLIPVRDGDTIDSLDEAARGLIYDAHPSVTALRDEIDAAAEAFLAVLDGPGEEEAATTPSWWVEDSICPCPEEHENVASVDDVIDRIVAESVGPEIGETPSVGLFQQAEPTISPLATELPTRSPAAKMLDDTAVILDERGAIYDEVGAAIPERSLEAIARYWNQFLHFEDEDELTGADVAAMMVLLKVARLERDPMHRDSWADVAGYAALGCEAVGA